MRDLDDIGLVRLAQKGNRDAFEVLLERHYDVMYRMAYKYCGRQNDAQDITQNVCLKLVRVLDQFKGDAAFTSWLYRIVLNTAKDYFRAQNRHNHSDQGLDTQNAKQASAEDVLLAQDVMDALKDLPEKEYETMILVVFDGLSHAEIALRHGCAESTVSWRIHEARKKLSQQLGRDHG